METSDGLSINDSQMLIYTAKIRMGNVKKEGYA